MSSNSEGGGAFSEAELLASTFSSSRPRLHKHALRI
jgi:hypothetical protein